MAHIIVPKAFTLEDKLACMQQDACYDVADSEADLLVNPIAVSSIRAQKTPPKVPKSFLSNQCVFNCAYCGCRASHDRRERYCINPRELAELSVQQAKQSRHGIFITSAIYRNADYTQELLIQTLRIIRHELHYHGYVHAKVMPGADARLIEQAAMLANRLSVNIEVAQSEGYRRVAHQKNRANILKPMQVISETIQQGKQNKAIWTATSQTTQLMAGSTGEDDRTIMTLSHALYHKYRLKRVYYTAFQYSQPVAGYDLPPTHTPSWRVKRLYQADRLMQLYGFGTDELTPIQAPALSEWIDPKEAWALRNLEKFPVEVNTADYEMLLRIPGIGITAAQRILAARRYARLSHELLRKMGVSLKRSRYFITCNGRFLGGAAADQPERLRMLLSDHTQLSFLHAKGIDC